MMRLKQREEVRVIKADGQEKGPYPAVFAGDTIIVDDQMAEVEEGDKLVRRLPNGKDEVSVATKVEFFGRGTAGFGPHYQVKFRKGAEVQAQRPGHQINISGVQSVQIGDHNTQNITNSLEALVKIIDSSGASADDKAEAKSRLARFLEHPIVSAAVGGGVGALVGAATRPQ